jgi:nucleoid-associated protein YgaU
MRQWRAAAVLLACGGFLVAAPGWLPSLPAAGTDAWWSWLAADPQRAVTLLAGLAGWLIAGWLLAVAALALLAASARRSGRLASRALDLLTPHFARGLVRILLGAAVAVSTAGPAAAGALPSLAPVPAPVVAAPELPPLLDLDRPGEATPKPAAQVPRTPAPAGRHRVRPGDTLWDLAAQRLPAGSSPSGITRAWQRWYAVNRQTIGADPGLLLVGEVLVVPPDSP